jgi:hypothetical protein
MHLDELWQVCDARNDMRGVFSSQVLGAVHASQYSNGRSHTSIGPSSQIQWGIADDHQIARKIM